MNHRDSQNPGAAGGPQPVSNSNPNIRLEWDWEIEHADRERERKADAALYGALPFEVDRKLLKDVVREKSCVDVARIIFLSSGTFHKAYLVTLVDGQELVARVARRYMPRLKTESEVATIQYLRENTNIPVPAIFHYDSNPYNRLGGEYILMSKAQGIPLSRVYHSLSYNDLVKLLTSIAELVIPLFAHRFPKLGSIYFGPDPELSQTTLATTPNAAQMHYSAFPFSPRLTDAPDPMDKKRPLAGFSVSGREFHIGPIISWPFFGSNRGELSHPDEINLGPWSSTQAYLDSCVSREVIGVIQENEGRTAPHRLHLDPDEIYSSRHHKLKAVPGDESDDSDEYDDLEESRAEWDGPGDAMYSDYRRMQRSTFLLAHLKAREDSVRREMTRWLHLMQKLTMALDKEGQAHGCGGAEDTVFAFDCHDLNLENMFVDANEPSRITCIIDWEATTTRPLWAAAHLPAFLQSSPFTANLFRDIVRKIASGSITVSPPPKGTRMSKSIDASALAREWLHYESTGFRLRMAHRCVEWDGWEEGLVESIIGPEEIEEDWFRDSSSIEAMSPTVPASSGPSTKYQRAVTGAVKRSSVDSHKVSLKLPFAKEMLKERVLDDRADLCGGRGGELGRRLEAWLTITGNHVSHGIPVTPSEGPQRWAHEETEHDHHEIHSELIQV